jgi:hypothetical protein
MGEWPAPIGEWPGCSEGRVGSAASPSRAGRGAFERALEPGSGSAGGEARQESASSPSGLCRVCRGGVRPDRSVVLQCGERERGGREGEGEGERERGGREGEGGGEREQGGREGEGRALSRPFKAPAPASEGGGQPVSAGHQPVERLPGQAFQPEQAAAAEGAVPPAAERAVPPAAAAAPAAVQTAAPAALARAPGRVFVAGPGVRPRHLRDSRAVSVRDCATMMR